MSSATGREIAHGSTRALKERSTAVTPHPHRTARIERRNRTDALMRPGKVLIPDRRLFGSFWVQ